MKEALTKEKTIVTNVGTLWVIALLLLSLAAGWFNMVNQVTNLEGDLDVFRAEQIDIKEGVSNNALNNQQTQINLAEINTRLTSIDATLLEIKASVGD